MLTAQKFKHGGCLITVRSHVLIYSLQYFTFSQNLPGSSGDHRRLELRRYLQLLCQLFFGIVRDLVRQNGRALLGKYKEPPYAKGWSLVNCYCKQTLQSYSETSSCTAGKGKASTKAGL